MKPIRSYFIKRIHAADAWQMRFLLIALMPVMMFSCIHGPNRQAGTRAEAELENPAQVLVINSNADVEKYRMMQEEFISHVPYSVQTLNAGNTGNGPASSIQKADPEIIFCIGAGAYLLASEKMPERPIVFSSVLNWMRLQMTHQTYGVSSELHAGMQMMLFKYIFPKLKKIGIIYSEEFNQQWVESVRETAAETGVVIIGRPLVKNNDPFNELKTLLPETDVFWLISDPTLIPDTDTLIRILKICDEMNKPVFSYMNALADYGATLIVSPDYRTIGRQAADIATDLMARNKETPARNLKRIVKDAAKQATAMILGENRADYVEYPIGSHVILNLKKVREYQIPYNEDALDSVNKIIR